MADESLGKFGDEEPPGELPADEFPGSTPVNEPDPADAASSVAGIEAPPSTIGGILRRLGPGLVLAGSIVGSGELIATTITGAEAGFWLLWLIVVGCVIKVFVQVELGRFAITDAKTTLVALNELPGPRVSFNWLGFSARGNWILWFWFLMFLCSLGQLGGIVGGVGQALSISWPLTAEGRQYNEELDNQVRHEVTSARLKILENSKNAGDNRALIAELRAELVEREPRVTAYHAKMAVHESFAQKTATLATYRGAVSPDDDSEGAAGLRAEITKLQAEVAQLATEVETVGPTLNPRDHFYWAALLTAVTIVMLVLGRYRFIERFVMILVGSFTVVTIGNVILLQLNPAWAISWDEIVNGLRFQGPKLTADQKLRGLDPVITALATFGIIGVGASELVAYPYWCIEKGYARWTGPREASESWTERARGWLRVMRWDAWCSMVIYTVATVAFYLLGAAVLNRIDLRPQGTEMIRTLGVMYEPVFGPIAQALFLFGSFAVLYSTFFVANAAHTRVAADVIGALGLAQLTETLRRRAIRVFGAVFPLTCLTVYMLFPKPVTLVLISGVMQALLLPMLAFGALYFRYTRCDAGLKPGKIWDLFLWLSFAGFLIVGVYLAYAKLVG